MPLTGVEYRRVASRGALLAFVRAHRERLAAQSAVPEDVKFRKTQEIAGKEAEYVSNGSSQSARKNTASVSAELIANSTTSSLSRAQVVAISGPRGDADLCERDT